MLNKKENKMKKYLTIFLLSCILLLSGCIGNGYQHKSYDKDTGKLTGKYTLVGLKGMVNDSKKDLLVVLPDGAILWVGSITTTDSPESAEALGKLIGAIIKTAITVP